MQYINARILKGHIFPGQLYSQAKFSFLTMLNVVCPQIFLCVFPLLSYNLSPSCCFGLVGNVRAKCQCAPARMCLYLTAVACYLIPAGKILQVWYLQLELRCM